MSDRLAGATSPTVRAGAPVLVPVGSLEQHGPHLPLETDTVIAAAVTARVAGLLSELSPLVAPPISYGASGEHQAFPGTTSIGSEVLEHLLTELTRSLRTWSGPVIFVNAHGGNLAALSRAVAQLREEGHDVAWVSCAVEGGDAHAGYTETSLMLHLCPRSVHLDCAEAGNTTPLPQLLPALLAGGVAAVSPNGVLGDPTRATAGEGQRVFDLMVREVGLAITAGRPDARGLLHPVERS